MFLHNNLPIQGVRLVASNAADLILKLAREIERRTMNDPNSLRLNEVAKEVERVFENKNSPELDKNIAYLSLLGNLSGEDYKQEVCQIISKIMYPNSVADLSSLIEKNLADHVKLMQVACKIRPELSQDLRYRR